MLHFLAIFHGALLQQSLIMVQLNYHQGSDSNLDALKALNLVAATSHGLILVKNQESTPSWPLDEPW